MDAHQRSVWGRMLETLDAYEHGEIALDKLSSDLKGLLAASDLHDRLVVNAFWDHFMEIDMELELRTEGWAPAGSSSDAHLAAALADYRAWVKSVLRSTDNERS